MSESEKAERWGFFFGGWGVRICDKWRVAQLESKLRGEPMAAACLLAGMEGFDFPVQCVSLCLLRQEHHQTSLFCISLEWKEGNFTDGPSGYNSTCFQIQPPPRYPTPILT